MLRSVVFIFVALLALGTTAHAFLFDRAQFLEAPFLGVVKAFAVVNASERVVVSISSPSENQLSRPALYMTLTLSCYDYANNVTDSFFVSRPLPDALQIADGISTSAYLSNDGELLWLYYTPPSAIIVLSVANCTVVYNISLESSFGFTIEKGWVLSEHTDGSPFPLVQLSTVGESAFVWTLPDGTQSSITFGEEVRWLVSAAADGTPLLYVVNTTQVRFLYVLTATVVNLTDASITYAASNLTTDTYASFLGCSFELNSTSIGFLGAYDAGGFISIILWTLDRTSLALSSQPITYHGDFTALALLSSGPTAVPSQILVWEVPGAHFQPGSIDVYLLDLVNESLTAIALPVREGFFLTAIEALGNGSVVFAECDTWEDKPGNAQNCFYNFIDSFNASHIVVSDDSVSVGSARLTYGSSIERNGHTLTLFQNLAPSSTPSQGFLIAAVDSPAVPLAYVSLPMYVPTGITFTMDENLRVYICPWNTLGVFQWRNFESYSLAGVVYKLFDSSYSVRQLEVYNNTLVVLAADSWSGRSEIEQRSLPSLELISRFVLNMSLASLSFQTNAIYAYGESGIAQLSTNLSSVVHRWPLPFPNVQFPLASVATADSYYAFFIADDLVCVRLPLGAPNAYGALRFLLHSTR